MISRQSVARRILRLSAIAIAAASCSVHAADAGADQIIVSGTAENAYRVASASMGPLGQQAMLDTPYSINAISSEFIASQQLKSVKEVFRYLPSVQGENIRPQTRGLQAGVVQNTRIDGLNMASTTDFPVEQFERIEVLNGLAGALYGPANPAGTFNYVLKRPTADTLRQVTLGYASKGQGMAAADLSGHVGDDGRYGYRINLLDDQGDGYVDFSHQRRKLISLAFDVQLAPGTVLETNASTYHYVSMGLPGTFSLAPNVKFPSAPSASTVGYGQPYAGDDNVTDMGSLRLRHDFSPDWHLTAGMLRQNSDRASTVPTNTLTNNAGAYTTTAATTTFSLDSIVSNTIALNGRVQAGGLRHEIVLANTGFDWERYTPFQTGAITLGKASLQNPLVFAQAAWPDFRYRYRAAVTRQQSLTLGDTIHVNDVWSVQAVASQSWISSRNYNKTGAATSDYDDSGISPSASLMYKPRHNMSAYLTYAGSLQQGDFAPAGTLNAGSSLAPYRSRQWELGYKVEWSKVNLSAALFRIERPFAYTGANNVFQVQGEQVNRGIELMFNTAVGRDVTLYGGVTWLDPRLGNTGAAATSETQILGLSRSAANLLAEYRAPFVPGLTVSLNLNYLGQRPGNNSNTDWVPGYTIADLGVRYAGKLIGKAATWSLSARNIGDRQYWANITPGGQNGYTGSGSGTGTLGAPRTVRASVQVNF
ncbi:TonB-dependent receptor [Janthinobacterium agaricidamnosum]|uniref:TonB-dependent siderophore receptor family protein n=1 Tax=Janthinobacterium agaricidamnosum NBRC 102515 = DSM 9628 TaxID=1349767 RepID=W0VDT8_9BURK|nr:TonB-dependent siderophore receptor [Janthinobacterium agaricidamnosum]CDG85447.1 tonB-dependent siderophore receptor family protein [Janthinobacterium agaricidamnosum NBRC 102515 = DSM 9628]